MGCRNRIGASLIGRQILEPDTRHPSKSTPPSSLFVLFLCCQQTHTHGLIVRIRKGKIGSMLPARRNPSSNNSATSSSPVSSAGITIDAATGEHYVPSSIRPDGSRRREIRVRPGYKPPEDVGIYKSRAAMAWKNGGKTVGVVPGADSKENTSDSSALKVGNIPVGSSTTMIPTASNKNAKRREARKKAKAVANTAEADGGVGEGEEADGDVVPTKNEKVRSLDNWRPSSGDNDTSRQEQQQQQQQQQEALDTAQIEKEKKARNLRKKLRQARELNDKKDQGESLLPDQLGKIIKISELVRQLDSLGLDSSGVDKDESQQKRSPQNDQK